MNLRRENSKKGFMDIHTSQSGINPYNGALSLVEKSPGFIIEEKMLMSTNM